MIGAYLYPYALPMVFGLPANEVTGTQLRLEDFDARGSRELCGKILNAISDHDRVGHIGDYLINKLTNKQTPDIVVQQTVKNMMSSHQLVNIDQLALDVNISRRQLERRFMNVAGLSPKLLSRLIRFQNSLRIPMHKKIFSLTDIALDAGYYDQSHFIRDFTFFSGLSPKEYFKLDRDQIADNFVQLRSV
jgi:AraC-like DNA-binding protein